MVEYLPRNTFPKLRYLEISLCGSDLNFCQYIVKLELPELEILNLHGSRLKSDDIKTLKTWRLPKLKKLHLSCNTDIGEGMGCDYLGEWCLSLPMLETLNLSDCSFKEKEFGRFQTPNLRKLEIRNIKVTGDTNFTSLCTWLMGCPELQKLDLRHNKIGVDGCEALKKLVKFCTKLKDLKLSSAEIGPGIDIFSELCLSQLELFHLCRTPLSHGGVNYIGDGGCKIIMSFLSKSPHLKELELCGNITDKGAEIIVNSLKKYNPEISRLSLWSNGIKNKEFIINELNLSDPLQICIGDPDLTK